MADGTSEAPKWRKNGIDMNDTVSPDTAAVLMLHHLKLAAAYFGALDIEPAADETDGAGELIDPLSFYLRSNDERRKLVLRHLERLHPERSGNEDYRIAVQMFTIAVNEYWAGVWREEFGPGTEGDAET
jgi:hypothetical protein